MVLPTAGAADRGLALEGVVKSFHDVQVLHGIDLTVRAGEFVSLVGPSGCGKTTTLNIVAGFLRPDRGDVRVDGRSIVDMPPHRRELGMVFQSHALFPHMTVVENVSFGLRMRRAPKAEIERRVGEALELVRLSGFESRYPNELSGGQQQRVGLARALTVRPRVILLDEPLSSLDAKLRREMQVELRAIQQRVETTAIYVTHDQEEALSLSDRVVVMNAGRIEQVGTPEDVYLRPASEFVAGFIGSANFLDGRVATVASDRMRVAIDGGGVVEVLGTGRPGEAVRLAVRPDRISLTTADGGPPGDAPQGTVIGRAFIGPVVRCIVELAGGRTVEADLRSDAEHRIEIGRTVRISTAPESWIVLPSGPR